MPGTIQIEIQTGYHSPWTKQFEQDVVTIGRSATADVRMHPTKDTACAREIHAVVELHDGGWRVTARHDSGVGVLDRSGRSVRRLANGESHRIDGELSFELGQGGPRLGVSVVGEVLPATEVRPSSGAPLPVGRVSGEVVASAQRAPMMIGAVALLVLLVAGGLGYWIFVVRGQGQQIAQQTTQQMQDLRQSIEAGTQLTSAQLEALGDSLTELREQPSDRMTQILLDVSNSVWLTGVMDMQTGAYEHGGTSWTVTKDRLATNAHVADQVLTLMRMYPGSVPVALPAGRREGMVVLSEDMLLHPGYKRWTDILSAQFRDAVGGGIATVNFIPPCDVALLKPAEEGADLGTPLKLAADMATRSQVGEPVGSVGFPTENIAGLPSQQRISGRVTSQTDFLFQTSEMPDAQLLHYSGVLAGGASGSPLLNENGEVIGLVSAGSMVFTGGRRIPVGINYAQRADLLVELLEDTADERQSERAERWSQKVREVLVSPERMMERIARLELGEVPVEFEDFEGQLTAEGIDSGFNVKVNIEPGSKYTLIGVSEDWQDVRLILLQGDRVVGRNMNPTWHVAINVPAQAEAVELTAVLYANSPIEGTSRVRFRVAREAPAPE